MLKILSTFFMVLLSSSFAMAQIKSVYTSLDEKHCRKMKNGSDNVIYNGRCPGVGGYKIAVAASEEHQWAELIAPSGKKFDVSISPVAYDSLGRTAEWRVKNGKPIALIIRFDLRDEFGGKVSRSLLAVSKISRTKACVTNVVEPSKTQNSEARKFADGSASQPCRPSEK